MPAMLKISEVVEHSLSFIHIGSYRSKIIIDVSAKKRHTHVFVGKRTVQSFWETVVGFPGNLLEQNNNN